MTQKKSRRGESKTGRARAGSAEPASGRVVLVDDDPSLLRLTTLRLETGGYEVEAFADAGAALGAISANPPDVVITDLRMEGMDGLRLFRQLREELPALPVIIITAYGTIADAVAATQEGLFSFITKPFDSTELLDTVAEAVGVKGAKDGQSSGSWHGVVTRSRVMQSLLSEVELVADSDASVLIQGESGTGKEIIARAIHAASARSESPFVAVNCAAVPADLLEAELFGHEKGAFTGAERRREGLFVQADGGSLLLDEIGDMPLAFQAKLLRTLETRTIRPIGARGEQRVDVRVLSATHRDLEQALESGEFREDLYYRLNVVNLRLPPLRERPEDIPLLAEQFLSEIQANSPQGRRIRGLSPEAVRLLVECDWPGNVRQLRNVIEQVCVLCRKGPVPADLVRRALDQESRAVTPLAEARAAFERDYLCRVLRLSGGVVSEAARLAGRNRTEFYRLLGRHHLDPADFKD